MNKPKGGPKNGILKVSAIKCKKCGDIIYSRTVHDFRTCTCEACFIDGGFDYCRIGGNLDDIEDVEVNVEATKGDLYQDWNFQENKYGLIKGEEHE